MLLRRICLIKNIKFRVESSPAEQPFKFQLLVQMLWVNLIKLNREKCLLCVSRLFKSSSLIVIASPPSWPRHWRLIISRSVSCLDRRCFPGVFKIRLRPNNARHFNMNDLLFYISSYRRFLSAVPETFRTQSWARVFMGRFEMLCGRRLSTRFNWCNLDKS